MSEEQEILKEIVKIALKQGMLGAGKLREQGRKQLELRSLRSRKDALYLKLGKEVEQLVQQGELSHPALERALTHLAQADADLEKATNRLAQDAKPDTGNSKE